MTLNDVQTFFGSVVCTLELEMQLSVYFPVTNSSFTATLAPLYIHIYTLSDKSNPTTLCSCCRIVIFKQQNAIKLGKQEDPGWILDDINKWVIGLQLLTTTNHASSIALYFLLHQTDFETNVTIFCKKTLHHTEPGKLCSKQPISFHHCYGRPTVQIWTQWSGLSNMQERIYRCRICASGRRI